MSVGPDNGAAIRAGAARAVEAVVMHKRGLDEALKVSRDGRDPRSRSLCRELVMGTLRWFWQLEHLAGRHLKRPIRQRDTDIKCLILVGIYQLRHTRIPAHAAVSETAGGADALAKSWAKAMVNGVLRNVIRDGHFCDEHCGPALQHSFPAWLTDRIQHDWPGQAECIFAASNLRPPMSLRVNSRALGRDTYLQLLTDSGLNATASADCPFGLILESPVDVGRLPGFQEGLVSVQDESAQWVAPLVDTASGHRVLDACAAPGGKTAHILEFGSGLSEVVALDLQPDRTALIRNTLERLKLSATVVEGSAAEPEKWWDGNGFDRILLDVPCSGTGVIRRHPDIKHLRRNTDIGKYAKIQRQILDAAWSMLNRSGQLLYTTCSILNEENADQINDFLSRHPLARVLPLPPPSGTPAGAGRQRLPGRGSGDGFFFARIEKSE